MGKSEETLARGVQDTLYVADGFEVRNHAYERYVFDGWQRIARVGVARPAEGGTEVSRFVYAGDHLGSATVVVRDVAGVDAGCVVGTTSHLPYGGIEAESGAELCAGAEGEEVYRFTGKGLERELGIYYFGARYYNPAIGRWLSVDPLTLTDATINHAAYMAMNNTPLVAVDRDGRQNVRANPASGTPLDHRKPEDVLIAVEDAIRVTSKWGGGCTTVAFNALQRLAGKPMDPGRRVAANKLVAQKHTYDISTQGRLDRLMVRAGSPGADRIAWKSDADSPTGKAGFFVVRRGNILKVNGVPVEVRHGNILYTAEGTYPSGHPDAGHALAKHASIFVQRHDKHGNPLPKFRLVGTADPMLAPVNTLPRYYQKQGAWRAPLVIRVSPGLSAIQPTAPQPGGLPASPSGSTPPAAPGSAPAGQAAPPGQPAATQRWEPEW